METIEILNQALSIIVPAAATLLATWFAVLGAQMKAKYNENENLFCFDLTIEEKGVYHDYYEKSSD